VVTARARREAVEFAHRRGLSYRRACALLRVARSSLRYQSRCALRDAPVVGRMRALSAQYPRYGYRRIRIFLARDGHTMSSDRAHRLWRTASWYDAIALVR
jgi:putative transposase